MERKLSEQEPDRRRPRWWSQWSWSWRIGTFFCWVVGIATGSVLQVKFHWAQHIIAFFGGFFEALVK
jgi:hypothetical protein